MNLMVTCGAFLCKGWPSEIMISDESSNRPLGVYCRCKYKGIKPSNICIHCNTHAAFVFQESRTRLVCRSHANNKMIHLSTDRPCAITFPDKTCGEIGCKGWREEVEILDKSSNKPLGVYCRCKRKGVKYWGICIYCDTHASYKFGEDGRGLTCKFHSNDKMRRLGDVLCEEEGCNKICSFNKPGEKYPRFCKDHKDPEMINVVNKRCRKEGC